MLSEDKANEIQPRLDFLKLCGSVLRLYLGHKGNNIISFMKELYDPLSKTVIETARPKPKNEGSLFFILLTLVYIFILFLFAGTKHFLLGNDIADIAFFEQFSWLIANGKMNVASSLLNRAPLQDHFSLLLLPIGIIYKVIPSTYTLLALQSIALGTLPGIAAYFSYKQNSYKQLTTALALSIAFCPYIFLVNLSNFHPEVITAPIMLIALIEVTKKRKLIFYT